MAPTSARSKQMKTRTVTARAAKPRKRSQSEVAEDRRAEGLEEAADALLAGNPARAEAKIAEATGANVTDAARMTTLRTLKSKLRELNAEVDEVREDLKRVKGERDATRLALERAVDEPLQPGLFDSADGAYGAGPES